MHDERTRWWVCDCCMRSVTREQIADMCDGEHVLCRACFSDRHEHEPPPHARR